MFDSKNLHLSEIPDWDQDTLEQFDLWTAEQKTLDDWVEQLPWPPRHERHEL